MRFYQVQKLLSILLVTRITLVTVICLSGWTWTTVSLTLLFFKINCIFILEKWNIYAKLYSIRKENKSGCVSSCGKIWILLLILKKRLKFELESLSIWWILVGIVLISIMLLCFLGVKWLNFCSKSWLLLTEIVILISSLYLYKTMITSFDFLFNSIFSVSGTVTLFFLHY